MEKTIPEYEEKAKRNFGLPKSFPIRIAAGL
jgi:hypothetical protein